MGSSSNFPEIKLKRNIGIDIWYILATVGTIQENKTLLAILKLVEQYGKVNEEIIINDLLNDSMQIVAEKLIQICKNEGLIEEDGRIKNVISSGIKDIIKL